MTPAATTVAWALHASTCHLRVCGFCVGCRLRVDFPAEGLQLCQVQEAVAIEVHLVESQRQLLLARKVREMHRAQDLGVASHV